MTDPIGLHSLLPCTPSLSLALNRCCPLSRPETQPRHICMVCLPLSLSLSPALDIFLFFFCAFCFLSFLRLLLLLRLFLGPKKS